MLVDEAVINLGASMVLEGGDYDISADETSDEVVIADSTGDSF
jgi:hypothetical protein